LVKSPEHIHTYRVSALSLWNASALGYTPEQVKEKLEEFSKYDIPDSLLYDIDDFMSRYGRIKLVAEGGEHWLISKDHLLLEEVVRQKRVMPFIEGEVQNGRVQITKDQRGFVKHALIQVGYPVEDLAGYVEGDPLDISLREVTLEG